MHHRPTPRSGRKVSLRREGSLAKPSSFRLGESSKRGTMASCDFSLRRSLLVWARLHLAQNGDSSLKRQLEQETWAIVY